MCLKVKSVFKILCFVSVIVLICYIEGKYKLIFPNSDKVTMAEKRILAADFEVFGIVQGELWQ